MKIGMIYLSLNVFKSEAWTLPGAKGSRPSGRRLLYGSTISHLGGKEGNPANISSWMCNINVISISVKIQYPQIFNIHEKYIFFISQSPTWAGRKEILLIFHLSVIMTAGINDDDLILSLLKTLQVL